ncbi:MAG: hypothetical protein WBA74_27210, partial [Cyclobacteriaceae bacterium]
MNLKSLLSLLTIILIPLLTNSQSFICGGQKVVYYKVTSESGLNLRKEPNNLSEIITKIPYGTSVYSCLYERNSKKDIINGEEGTWEKVYYGYYEGYVFDRFLSREKDVQILRIQDWEGQGDESAFKKDETYFGVYEREKDQSVLFKYEGKEKPYYNPAFGDTVRYIDTQEDNSPEFIVSCINLMENQVVYGKHLKNKMLYPGEAVQFHYSVIYATGEPKMRDKDQLMPFYAIENYKLILRERAPTGESFREEVLFELDIPAWSADE